MCLHITFVCKLHAPSPTLHSLGCECRNWIHLGAQFLFMPERGVNSRGVSNNIAHLRSHSALNTSGSDLMARGGGSFFECSTSCSCDQTYPSGSGFMARGGGSGRGAVAPSTSSAVFLLAADGLPERRFRPALSLAPLPAPPSAAMPSDCK